MVNLVNKITDKSIYILMGFQLCIMIMIIDENMWSTLSFWVRSPNEPFVKKYVYKKKHLNVLLFLIKNLKLSQFSYNKCHTINALFMLLCSLMLSLPVRTATSLLLLTVQKHIIEHILKYTVDLTKISH